MKTAQLSVVFLLCAATTNSFNSIIFCSSSSTYKTSHTLFISSLHPLADQKVSIPAFDIQSLLPKDLGRYYRYNGSLTTPPCYQSVIWMLFHERVQISKAQVKLRLIDPHMPRLNSHLSCRHWLHVDPCWIFYQANWFNMHWNVF